MEVRAFGKAEKVTVTLYSLLGQSLQTTAVVTDQAGKALVKLPVPLKVGTYILKAYSTAGEAQTKLVQE